MNDKLSLRSEGTYLTSGEGYVKAFSSISINGIIFIKGIRVLEGKNGLFVSMPQSRGKDGKWYDLFFSTDKDISENIKSIVLKGYYESLKENKQ